MHIMPDAPLFTLTHSKQGLLKAFPFCYFFS